MTRTLHEELRAETRDEHLELEGALNLLRPEFTIRDYVDLLVRYHALYAPFEQFLAGAPYAEPVPKVFLMGVRQRTRWLVDDLRRLGVAVQLCRGGGSEEGFMSVFPRTANLFGAMYVIEGSALGGMVIAKHFTSHLGLGVEDGLRFLYGYGQKTKEKWMAVLQLLSECDAGGLPRNEIVEGARRTFSLLQTQLVSAPVT